MAKLKTQRPTSTTLIISIILWVVGLLATVLGVINLPSNLGIATNSKGHIYIYHRAYETRLFEYTPQGDFVREIGRNNYGFAFAHSVRVDRRPSRLRRSF